MSPLEIETLKLLIGAEFTYEGKRAYVISYNDKSDTYTIDLSSDKDDESTFVDVKVIERNELLKFHPKMHEKIVKKLHDNLKKMGRIK
jgi:hypothetical protein